jgi:DNA-binding response OmpR family regulator
MAATDQRSVPWTFVLDEPTSILVVDDDPILREFATVHLGTPFTSIDTACDGTAALARLKEASYDVVLLDIEMPRLDGLSLLHEIRSDKSLSALPVIMLTGNDDIASIDRAYHLGANSFATKPVNWRQLSYQIRYVLRTSQLERLQSSGFHLAGEHDRDLRSQAPEDLREFFQDVLRKIDSMKENLAVQEAQWAEPLQYIRGAALQALADSTSISSSARSNGRVPTVPSE